MATLKKHTLLRYRHKAEELSAGLPALIAEAERTANSIMSGTHIRHKAGTGEKFWQFRDYDPSDRPQDIDWRQSARGDRLFVREKEWQTSQNVFLWCQHNDSLNYHSQESLPKKQEAAIILCLAMSLLLSRAGERISPLEGNTTPGRGEAAIRNLGEHLTTHATEDLPDIRKGTIPRNANLILAGDFLAPADEIEETFAKLASSAGKATILQILDPAELTLPFEGRLILTRPNSKEQHTVENAASVRSAYCERLRAHLDFIKDCCRKHGWNWFLHTTDKEIRSTLLDAWVAIAPSSFHDGGKG